MTAILPPATLGLLGGGQLGRFFVLAAQEMGYSVHVLDPDPDCPAGRVANHHLCAGFDDRNALCELSRSCAAITLEFENVPARSLGLLEEDCIVRPSAKAVGISQSRVAEKTFLQSIGIAQGPWRKIDRPDDLEACTPELFPGILKRSDNGYDGKGQATVGDRHQAAEILTAWKHPPSVIERRLPLQHEMSIVLARTHEGDIRLYPAVENHHANGVLDYSIVPARIAAVWQAEAEAMACRIARALDYVGVMAVEFFLSDGRLLVNELAPRPHNSGHFTLDAAFCSQFEQQVRALCGLPLGECGLSASSVMVNLLGDLWPANNHPDWSPLIHAPALKLHLYGKKYVKAGRKMGHYTALAANIDEALALAMTSRSQLGLVNEKEKVL